MRLAVKLPQFGESAAEATVMAWLVALVAFAPLYRTLPHAGIEWLIAGGIIYSIGAVIFATNRPNLWPGRFMAHDLWHLLVLAGSGCHFFFDLQVRRSRVKDT